MKLQEKELLEGIKPLGLGLLVEKENALVLSDLHLGFEDFLASQGMLVPRTGFKAAVKALNEIFRQKDFFDLIIVNGDLKHEFGRINEQEWREVIDFLELAGRHCNKIVLIKGNHDSILGPIARFRNLEVKKELFLHESRAIICHGNEVPEGKEFVKAKTIIIGHEHASVSLRDGVKKETFKAFLKGKFKGRNLIVMPSFFFMAEGSDLLKDETLSPFLEGGVTGFEAWLCEEGKTFYFGRIKNLQKD